MYKLQWLSRDPQVADSAIWIDAGFEYETKVKAEQNIVTARRLLTLKADTVFRATEQSTPNGVHA